MAASRCARRNSASISRGGIRCQLHRRGATAFRIGRGRTVPCGSGLAIHDDRLGLRHRQQFRIAEILEQAERVAVERLRPQFFPRAEIARNAAAWMRRSSAAANIAMAPPSPYPQIPIGRLRLRARNSPPPPALSRFRIPIASAPLRTTCGTETRDAAGWSSESPDCPTTYPGD